MSQASDPALERPQNLKKWSSELVGILKGQEAVLFDGWKFDQESLTRADYGRILKKMTGCGSVVELRAAVDRKTGEMGAPVVHAANYCGQHTICPYCAGRVQDRRGARFKAAIVTATQEYKYASMLTATIAPVPTWLEDLNKIISGWQAFRKKGQRRARYKIIDGKKIKYVTRDGGEWGKILGGLAKVELKRGAESHYPHCHIHALVFHNERFDFRVWSDEEKLKPVTERLPLYRIPSASDPRGWVPSTKINTEWFSATDGAGMNLEVSPLFYKAEHKAAGMSYSQSIIEQSREVLKYATKFDSSPAAGAERLFATDFIGIRGATYGRRLFFTYGSFRKIAGNDFQGGGPHISEGPAIYEARWRGSAYSELIPRSRTLFPNSDKSEKSSERLSKLNQLQGRIRRMRSAILKSKNHFRDTGALQPAFYAKREYLDGGGFKESLQILEVPGYIVAAPREMTSWERWIDETLESGRECYKALRIALGLESEERIIGTREERDGLAAVLRRANWMEDEGYDAKVIKAFLCVLCAPNKMLVPSQAPP
jgi:hypothetical protein